MVIKLNYNNNIFFIKKDKKYSNFIYLKIWGEISTTFNK